MGNGGSGGRSAGVSPGPGPQRARRWRPGVSAVTTKDQGSGRGGDRAGPGKHEQREKLPERGAQLVFKSGPGKREGCVRGSGTQQSAGAEARARARAGRT